MEPSLDPEDYEPRPRFKKPEKDPDLAREDAEDKRREMWPELTEYERRTEKL